MGSRNDTSFLFFVSEDISPHGVSRARNCRTFAVPGIFQTCPPNEVAIHLTENIARARSQERVKQFRAIFLISPFITADCSLSSEISSETQHAFLSTRVNKPRN